MMYLQKYGIFTAKHIIQYRKQFSSNMQYRKFFLAAFFVLSALLAANTAQAQITTGSVAPELTLPDQNNVNQSLGSLRGNWVLVYFWVSWDGASRAATPKLASLYGKYQNAGFTSARGFRVYTVSLDSDKKEWVNALKTDAIPGPYNVNDFYSVSAATYQVQKVPSAYLVDASGIIRAVNPSFADVESILNADAGKGGTVAMQTFNTGAAVNTAAKMESVRGGALQTTSATSYYNQTTTATTTTPSALPEGNTYKIQIGAYKKLNLGDFYGVSQYGNVVSEPADNDIKRVMVGNFDSKQAAVDALYRIQKEGYPDAFLVEYKNAQRVRVVGKSEIQAPVSAAPVSAVSNGNTIAVPLASAPQPATDLVYRSAEPTAMPSANTNTSTFNATAKNTGSSGSTVIYTAPPSYSLPSQVTVYTNTPSQNTQGTIYDQPGFISSGSDKTYVKNASVNTPSGTGTMQVYTPGDTRFTNTTATTTQPAKTTTQQRPTTTTQQPATTGNQPSVPPKQPGTTTAQPPQQPGGATQPQQPSPVVSPTSENSLEKQIDNYMGGYDYTLLENSKSKRLKNKSKREKKKDKKKK
ncbi:hypothetical protein C7N43_24255 [Sphingobacteriales bacterium UPWRP_1]|nr:hypothetical protein BVG80_16595 [Sphingobacteriales bacterium TSM_CSM]PSJ74371.1 hypothetical protein C7N43_24255 [Sphingobacteriales bacterium UPWRP_1]